MNPDEKMHNEESTTENMRRFDINSHLPQWAKDLVDLYTSTLKDEIKEKLENSRR